MIPEPKVRKVLVTCSRCQDETKVYAMWDGARLCVSCIRILYRLATV